MKPWFALFPALFAALFCALFVPSAPAADGPYNEAADARAEIQAALADAGRSKALVLVVFGANWCPDCKLLDLAMKQGATAALVARDFKVVKVDVGRFDRNLGVAEAYGLPLKRGIPAVVVLSSANEVKYLTRAGELADARRMGEQGIHDFLSRMLPHP